MLNTQLKKAGFSDSATMILKIALVFQVLGYALEANKFGSTIGSYLWHQIGLTESMAFSIDSVLSIAMLVLSIWCAFKANFTGFIYSFYIVFLEPMQS